MIWSKKGKQKSNGVKTLFILLALVMILPLALGALLLNDVGQLFNLPTSWVFNFYYYRIQISIAACILAILLVIYQCSPRLFSPFYTSYGAIYFHSGR
jgi:cell division protein FtsW (lipid II flippase)